MGEDGLYMNITYLVGNGFDLNLGLETRDCLKNKYCTNESDVQK